MAYPSTDISILTLNTQKVGYNSPSLTDLVAILDLHKPDILMLTETPMHPHHGALTHVCTLQQGLRNSLQPGELPAPLKHAPISKAPNPNKSQWRGVLDSVQKQASWAATIHKLLLPESCLRATTCAIGLTLHSG